MNRIAKLATAVAGVIAVPATLLATAPSAHADIDREGRYAGAEWEFSVDRENRGFEVSVDVDDATPGSRWKIVLWHDGKRYVKTTRAADREGDVEIERFRPNTAGKDVFKVKIKRIGAKGAVVRTITTR